MEIRSSLKKIDNYLKIVTELNATILEEGTMSPEELQIMKKYLYNCVERIENVQVSLGLPVSTEPRRSELAAPSYTENIEGDIVKPIAENTTVSEEVFETEVLEPLEDTINIEPVTFLKADLPSIKFKKEINAQHYYQEILEAEDMIEQSAESQSYTLVSESFYDSSSLVADDIEEDEERISFETKEQSVENVVELVSEPKSETLNESTMTLSSLVADDIEKDEEKISFETKEQSVENIVELVSEPKSETLNESTITSTSLVADDIEKDEEKISFETQEISENNKVELVAVTESSIEVDKDNEPLQTEKAEVTSLVDESNDKEVVSYVTNVINEYDSILNKKSLSESIALNDKFIFVRELFGSQFSEYESSIKEIDSYSTHQEALEYCNTTLATKYNWNDRKSIAERFLEMLAKNYNS